jgi:hypothetical protein
MRAVSATRRDENRWEARSLVLIDVLPVSVLVAHACGERNEARRERAGVRTMGRDRVESGGVGGVDTGPAVDGGSDLTGDVAGPRGDGSVGEPQDDPPVRSELSVVASVALELLAVATVIPPSVALDDDRRPDHTKVDLATADLRMELNRWEAVVGDQSSHRWFENRIGRFRIDRPSIDCCPQRNDACTTASTVLVECGFDGREGGEFVGESVSDRSVDLRWCNRAEVDKSPEEIGACDSGDSVRCESAGVARPVDVDASESSDERRSRGRTRLLRPMNDDVDRRRTTRRNTVKQRRGPVRCHGTRSGGEHCCDDLLLGGVGGADDSADTGMKWDQWPAVSCAVPGRWRHSRLLDRDQPVLAARDRVEFDELHESALSSRCRGLEMQNSRDPANSTSEPIRNQVSVRFEPVFGRVAPLGRDRGADALVDGAGRSVVGGTIEAVVVGVLVFGVVAVVT